MQASPFLQVPARAAARLVVGVLLTSLASASLAVDASPAGRAALTAAPSSDPAASYRDVDLKKLVAGSRTEVPGQRVIFAPSPIKFRATLAALPAPQKADYLLAALAMMKISNPPRVSQRIGLDYGGDRALAAYIDDAIADRLANEAKPGQVLTFYAFHVYNHSRGPALLVTSFAD